MTKNRRHDLFPHFRVAFSAVALFVLAWWVALQFQVAQDTTWNYLFNVAYAVPWLLAAAGFFWVAWRWRKDRLSETTPMVLLGISFLFSSIAQGIWSYYNFAGVDVPEFSAADVFFVSGVVIQIVAVLALLIHQLRARPVSRPVAVAFGIGTVALSFYVADLVFGSLQAQGTAFSLDTFYAVTGFLIIFLYILNINRDRHGELRPFLYAMFFAAIVSAAGDLVFAVHNAAGTYWNGELSDGLYAVSALLVMFAVGRMLPRTIDHAGVDAARPDAGPKFDLLLPIGIVIIGVIVAARFAQGIYASRADALVSDTQMESRRVADIIDEILDQEVSRVSAVSGLFLTSGTVSQDAFVAFTGRLTQYESGASALLHVDARGRVTNVEGNNLARLGFDYATDPDRALLLSRAIDARALTFSAPLLLHTGTPGILIVLPEFRGDTYVGASVASIPLPDLMRHLASILPDDRFQTTLHVDGDAVSQDGWTVYDDSGTPILTGIERTLPVEKLDEPSDADIEPVALDGANWSVSVAPDPAQAHAVYATALATFLSVLAAVCAVALIVYLLVSQRSRLREQLRIQTRSLRQSIDELKMNKFFLDNVSDGVIVLDLHRHVIYRNKAAATFVGPESAKRASETMPFSKLGIEPDELEHQLEETGRWDGESEIARTGGKQIDALVSVRPLSEGKKRLANVVLLRDITDRKTVERAKTQFVSMVAHQLRTPMTQLRWIVEQMLEQKQVPKALAEPLTQLQEIVLAQNQFVGDLLNVSRIERGVLKLDKKPVPLSKLLSEIVDPLRPLAKERHTRLTIGEMPDVSVSVDEEKMAQALRNIVDNALKYTPPENDVTVAATRQGAFALVTIADHGTGIPESLWDKLYDIKTEISPGATSGSGSTGLGLYLTKKFVDAMGATIAFKTGAKGTTFEIRIPVA